MITNMACPECNGDGYITYEVARRQSFDRDIGYLEDVSETCPLCLGDGEIDVNIYRDDEDE
jgi:DnaJ-class molecular chaperone